MAPGLCLLYICCLVSAKNPTTPEQEIPFLCQIQQSLRIHLIIHFDLMGVLGGTLHCVRTSDSRAAEGQ